MKKIATMQDISCVGKCSLTVALPVMSAMGIETAVIPTAVLSTHTMFKGFTFCDLTDEIEGILNHWEKENFRFDAVYTGYLGSKRQIEIAKDLFARFAQKGIRLVDPCMADNGKLYAGFTPEFAKEMNSLCAIADIICPNLTEASFLLDIPYQEEYDEAYIKDVLVKLTDSNATRAKVISQLNALFTKATSADRIVLFFSGHGMPGYFLCYDGLLSYKQIVEVMRRSKASCKMVMADACFSGKMRSSKQRGKKYSSKDVMFFLSSRSNEPSKESSFSNSVFTIYLERGLRGGADKNKDRVITARELYEFVHKGVIGATDNSQHPVMWGNFNDNMVILKWR